MKRPIGYVKCTIAALHELEEVLFQFIEDHFNIIDVDHSRLDEEIVTLLLEDFTDWGLFELSEIPLHYTFLASKDSDTEDYRITVEKVEN